jgi:hypothetical protein
MTISGIHRVVDHQKLSPERKMQSTESKGNDFLYISCEVQGEVEETWIKLLFMEFDKFVLSDVGTTKKQQMSWRWYQKHNSVPIYAVDSIKNR